MARNTITSCWLMRGLGAAVATLAGLASSAALAQSDGPGNDYCVKHKFKWSTSGNLAPEVRFGYYAKAYARTNSCKHDPVANQGVIVIGAGVTTRTAFAIAPDSTADSAAIARITTLAPGSVAGEIEASGNADPALTGCPPPNPPRGFGWSRAYSAAKVSVRGRKVDRNGNIQYSGDWKSREVAGSASRGIVRDPIVARLIDNTTGVTTTHTLMKLMVSNSDGSVAWQDDMLSNSSGNMELDLVVDSPVLAQTGRLKIKVDGGIVTELLQLGLFSTAPLPAVGSPGGFSIPFPPLSLDYDLGGNPDNDLVPEFDFDNGGEVEKAVAGLDDGGSMVTDIATGHDGACVSQIPVGDTINGYNVTITSYLLADDFVVEPGPPRQLDMLLWPVYEVNAPAQAPVGAAFVQIWQGPPGMGGVPIAGDLVTNRLLDSRFRDLYRTGQANPQSNARAVKELAIDMSWAPALAQGEYWLVVGAQGTNSPQGTIWTPPSPWKTAQDNAMQFNVQTNQWQPLRDPQSFSRASLPFVLCGSEVQHTPCYPDCNGDGVLNLADFGCFQTRFATQHPYADCNGDGQLNLADFGCFQTRFAIGCP